MARGSRLSTSKQAPHPAAPPGHRSRGILWGRVLGTLLLVVLAIALGFGALALMDEGDPAPAADETTQHLPLPAPAAGDAGLIARIQETDGGFPVSHEDGAGCAGVPLAP